MAGIIPLRGLRYDERKAGAIKDLVTPPYDVIDREAQEGYYNRSPFNIIRLEYGKQNSTDSETENRYTRAADYFCRWQNESVLSQEEEPAIYLYRQRFTVAGQEMERTGIICGVKLEPYEKGVVLPHEETMPGHKADRLALMQACGANFSPIFGLYSDQSRTIDRLLDQVTVDSAPEIRFVDEWGQGHRLWVVKDPDVLRQVRELMEPRPIFIADGHHRYETALNYARENDAAGHVMMTLVNLYDPGLVVLPTHRLIVSAKVEPDELLEALQQDFLVERVSERDVDGVLAYMAKKVGLDSPGGNKNGWVFGLYTGAGNFFVLQLKDEKIIEQKMPADRSPAWCRLDVSVLQKLILDNVMGIGQDALAGGAAVQYTRDAGEAVQAVEEGRCRASFLMNPTGIAEVTTVAENGEKMPQKSTFFYPKLITGLVINKF
ncbi:MAG TPA: DUF1015 domain-containing protein [Desulfotomaculum sp.]|nr:MAG: hypothetical protein VR67_16570 [Peptococcaceae bacterium BRH_c8a]KJS76610.1 MAG: hypothetical protein JL56_04885 [Desulfotomaculum sp. BICA1-6]HBX23676.1 DUF1015 domain-containing protein [Desulfotomaculum sp.]